MNTDGFYCMTNNSNKIKSHTYVLCMTNEYEAMSYLCCSDSRSVFSFLRCCISARNFLPSSSATANLAVRSRMDASFTNLFSVSSFSWGRHGTLIPHTLIWLINDIVAHKKQREVGSMRQVLLHAQLSLGLTSRKHGSK